MPGSGWFNQGADGLLEFHKGIRPLSAFGVYVWDDFTYGAGAFNSHVPQFWVTTETGAATPFAPGAAALNGLATAVTGATTNNAEELAGKDVGFKPSTMGPLYLEIRASFVGATTAKDGDHYLGFANAVTYTNGLPFVLSAASAFTTSAPVEFAGIGYSSIPTSGLMFNSGGNNFYSGVNEINSVVGTLVPSTVAKDSNMHVYRVTVDTAGNAQFSLDNVVFGGKALAVTAATAVVPYINAVAKNSHTNTATVDYILVGATQRV